MYQLDRYVGGGEICKKRKKAIAVRVGQDKSVKEDSGPPSLY